MNLPQKGRRGDRANDYIVTVNTVTGNILPLEATFQWGAGNYALPSDSSKLTKSFEIIPAEGR